MIGQFGHDGMKHFPCTFGLSKKGIDKEEFEKCLFINIIRLYPNALDISCKKVVIKIDSGLEFLMHT